MRERIKKRREEGWKKKRKRRSIRIICKNRKMKKRGKNNIKCNQNQPRKSFMRHHKEV